MMKIVIFVTICCIALSSALVSDDEMRDRVIEKASRQRRACVKPVSGNIAGAAKGYALILGRRASSGCIGGGNGMTSSGSGWADSCLYGGGIKPGRPVPIGGLGKRDLSDFKKPNRDYIFVLDTSGSIPDSDFEKAKESMASLVRSFCPIKLGYDTSVGTKQVAVVLFDGQATTNIPFEESHKGIDHLVRKIINLRHRRGSTATARALQHVLKDLLQGDTSRLYNNDTSTIVNVITDGRCNVACQTLAKDADNIRNAGPNGVQLFALGIGNARACELEILSGKGKDLAFELKDFNQFEQFVKAIKHEAESSVAKCI